MLLADEEAASEVRLGRAREPRDAGKENPFTWLGCPVHPDCGATRPFDFKTQTTRVKYWLAAKCSSTTSGRGSVYLVLWVRSRPNARRPFF